eukprot:5608487-Amphidinium_carterae.1
MTPAELPDKHRNAAALETPSAKDREQASLLQDTSCRRLTEEHLIMRSSEQEAETLCKQGPEQAMEHQITPFHRATSRHQA